MAAISGSPEAFLKGLRSLLRGAPSTVILAPPNGDGRLAVGSGILNRPGRYALFCAIPIGADPDEYLEAAKTSVGPPVVPGGAPHFTSGMFAEVTVTG